MDRDEALAYVFNRGRHRGKTLEEVALEDPRYLIYCATKLLGLPRRAARVWLGLEPDETVSVERRPT